MTTATLAHAGEHAGERPIGWQPEQVQSGSAGSSSGARTLATALGWFSIGLGVVQVVAPQRITSLIGAPDTTTSRLVTRAMGVRELTHGLGILGSKEPTPWVWSRVLGDALDIGSLGKLLTGGTKSPARTMGALAAVAGTTATDLLDSVQLGGSAASRTGPMIVKAAATIDRSAADIYAYWRDFENLPDIMTHLKSVEHVGDGLTRWEARAPLGMSVSWTAELEEDVPDERIRWRSRPGSMVTTAGEVRLVPAPGDRGTELHVWLTYEAPAAGSVASALLKLFGDDPVQQVKDDVRRFKQVMETGQVVRSDGTPRGADARLQPKQRPAQPVAD